MRVKDLLKDEEMLIITDWTNGESPLRDTYHYEILLRDNNNNFFLKTNMEGDRYLEKGKYQISALTNNQALKWLIKHEEIAVITESLVKRGAMR